MRVRDRFLPRELQFHELEESREFRDSGGYRRKSSNKNRADRRQIQPESDDMVERYRPIEYRRPIKNDEDEEEEEEVVDKYEQFKKFKAQQRAQ